MRELYLTLLVLSAVFQIVSSKRKYGYMFNPIFLFNIIFFLHNWSFSLSRVFFTYLTWYTPNNGDLYDEQLLLINLSCLWAFYIAFVIFGNRKKKAKLKFDYDFNIYLKLFYVTSIITVLQTISNQSEIYGANQAIDASSSYSPLGILLFSHSIFGGIILINTKNKSTAYIILAIELIIAIFTGTRKAFIIVIFTYLICNFEFIKFKFNIYKTTLSLLVVSFIFYLTIFLAVFRESFGESLTFNARVSWTNQLILDDADKFIIYTLNSANSEAVQTWVLELVEEDKLPPIFGLSYLQALVNTIILRPFQGNLVNYQAAYYFKSVAYPNVQNQGYDFSFTAEGIVNWKNFAFISYFILGFVITKIYDKRYFNNYYNTLYILIMALLYVVMRTDATSFFRYISFFVFTFILFRGIKVIKLRRTILR